MRRFPVVALVAFPLLATPAGSLAQTPSAPPASQVDPRAPAGVIRAIEFHSLRRIPAATLRAQLASREGEPLDPALLERDVRALDRLGWFDEVRAEIAEVPVLLAHAEISSLEGRAGAAGGEVRGGDSTSFPGNVPRQTPLLRLVFLVEERPFLSEVKFRGSRLLGQERIEAILREKGIALRLARPVDRTALWRAARTLEAALGDLGHPQARVRIRLLRVPSDSLCAVFYIHEGPRIAVARVEFTGNTAFSDHNLLRQMKRVAPGALFAGLRGKTIYTPLRLAEDFLRLEEFYRNQGYAEARVGVPQATLVERSTRRWSPFPSRRTELRLDVIVPVEEGAFYRLESVMVEGVALQQREALEKILATLRPQQPYSEQKLLRARDAIAQLRPAAAGSGTSLRPAVEVIQQFDRAAGTACVVLRAHTPLPYTVRRIRFLGNHRFSDRYYRRRILLKEGGAFDPEKLERGLAQLARTGFLRPVSGEAVRVEWNEAERTADVTIRFEEIGRQRVSLVGGVSTLGIAYNVFNLLGGEEMLTAHVEGGPASLSVLLGLAKEGLFGTQASLGLNLFHNVVRPRLPGASGRQRLFTARSSGTTLAWSTPLSHRDTLGASYEVSRTSTRVHLGGRTPGLAGEDLLLSNSRRALGLTWTRRSIPLTTSAAARERIHATASVSGGPLGGGEHLLRSSLEYARLHPDPATRGRNAWAFRGYLAGVSSYAGRPLLVSSRFLAGEELVRGLRPGELSPYSLVPRANPDGTTSYRAESTGANLVAAINSEYRVPLNAAKAELEAAAFFDAGAGWLLPGRSGNPRPDLLDRTNGLVHATTGLELRVRLPVLNETLRFHYAADPLGLVTNLLLPDGSHFRLRGRRAAVGWALGTLF